MIGILNSKRIESYDITGQFNSILDIGKFEYFVYRWENITKNHPNFGMVYIGYHKGKAWDGYWQTSKNPKFKRDFANKKVKWDYQILRYDLTEKEAKDYEGNCIREIFKKEKQRSYNMHPGSKKVLDFEKVEEMFKKIKDTIEGTEKHFEIEIVDRGYLKNLVGTQAARASENPDRISYISNDIDDEMGDTSYTKPLTVAIDENDVCDIGKTEFRINGLHTQKGILKSKHAVDGKVIKVEPNRME